MAVVRSTYAFHQRPFSVSHVPLVIFPAVHAPHLVPRTEHLRATSAVVDAVSLGDEVGVSILVIPDRAEVRYPLGNSSDLVSKLAEGGLPDAGTGGGGYVI